MDIFHSLQNSTGLYKEVSSADVMGCSMKIRLTKSMCRMERRHSTLTPADRNWKLRDVVI